MRIGLTAGAASVDAIIRQAERAEADGFTSLWYASNVDGDPLVAIALAGRATSRIELGTAVLQTYPCHPLLQANRVAAAANGMGRPGFTLGIGPSHEALVSDVYGMSYEHPGRNTEEYIRILTTLLREREADIQGADWKVRTLEPVLALDYPMPVLLSAMSPRMLRVAGSYADGTVCWMASARVIESRVAPAITAAAGDAGRPAPRIVAGLPVAVHDDIDEARTAAGVAASVYSTLPNYKRILDAGGLGGAAEAAIVGNEKSVTAQLQALLDAGATDIWAATVPVGADRRSSVQRTMDLLRSLIQ